MDQTSDEFGLDLGSFDIRDFVPDGEGPSMFEDQGRDKARLQAQAQAQRSLLQSPPQYYGFQPVSDPSNPNNGPVSPNPNPNNPNNNINPAGLSPLSLEQLNMLLNVGLSQPMMAQDPHQGGQGAGSALANSADALKEQLAQQIKLQQLQQLQNHILQQQVRFDSRPLMRMRMLMRIALVADSIAHRWSKRHGNQGCPAVAHSRYVSCREIFHYYYHPLRTTSVRATEIPAALLSGCEPLAQISAFCRLLLVLNDKLTIL